MKIAVGQDLKDVIVNVRRIRDIISTIKLVSRKRMHNIVFYALKVSIDKET